MTNGLSRREMVLFGTAGCALSGCSGPEARQPKAAAGQQHGKALEEGRGVGAPWGKDAHQGPGSKYPSFAPEYVALLHLGFEKQWKIRINHACMHFKASPVDRLNKAIEIFEDLTEKGNQRFRSLTQHKFYTRKETGVDSETFDNFRFKSPVEIFIFIAHPKAQLQDVLMMFTEFSIRDLKNSCAKNYSFFNARAVDTFAMSRKLDAKGKMIRVENYACNEDGADINVPNQRYSMNIYFAVDAGPTGPVTLVVDPDTGNGTGNEP